MQDRCLQQLRKPINNCKTRVSGKSKLSGLPGLFLAHYYIFRQIRYIIMQKRILKMLFSKHDKKYLTYKNPCATLKSQSYFYTMTKEKCYET